MNKEYFIKRARDIHGDKYDYSKVELSFGTDKVEIICPSHGSFMQRAKGHLEGRGCSKCARERYREKKVCGIGINDYNGRDVKMFTVWRNMLYRCYEKTRNSSYSQCTVCESWLSLNNFSRWYYKNYKEGWQLDKDILSSDSKAYSPETCCFVPAEINMCVVGRKSESVTFVKGAWQASFNQRYIGRYATKELAVAAYRSRKAEHILCLAEKHNNELPRKVRDRLIDIANALRLAGVDKEINL